MDSHTIQLSQMLLCTQDTYRENTTRLRTVAAGIGEKGTLTSRDKEPEQVSTDETLVR